MTHVEVVDVLKKIDNTFYCPTPVEKAFMSLLAMHVANGVAVEQKHEFMLYDILHKGEEYQNNWESCDDFFTGFEHAEDIH